MQSSPVPLHCLLTSLQVQVMIEGIPADPAWPTAAELKQLLVTRSGRAVSTQDIEADVFTLLSTGRSEGDSHGKQSTRVSEG